MSEAEFIQAQVNRDIEERLADEAEQVQQITSQKHATEVSPWLDLTQWPKYLRSHSFSEVASLGMLPDPSREPLLTAFAQSVERLVKLDLKPSTYTRYQQVWQRLICFAYRSSPPDQEIILRHQLTTTQFAKLD
ncbi:hypothetical protein PENSUB_12539 [Penicillium subrubescens]|uniref:Uncharacterized protein n=1 Tax=Penicillium subrubescens TaxID=1316194 RepID=A0A1Q5SYG9_9EURO|nr:hypothetical protein PENSUB_12539 [Penicillium subrubescens]